MTPERAIEAAEQIEAETAYRNQLGREMYEAGRRDAEADMATRWAAVAEPAASGGTSYAELEERRYGTGGQAHFGDPRPGDFPGRTEPQGAESMTAIPEAAQQTSPDAPVPYTLTPPAEAYLESAGASQDEPEAGS